MSTTELPRQMLREQSAAMLVVTPIEDDFAGIFESPVSPSLFDGYQPNLASHGQILADDFAELFGQKVAVGVGDTSFPPQLEVHAVTEGSVDGQNALSDAALPESSVPHATIIVDDFANFSSDSPNQPPAMIVNHLQSFQPQDARVAPGKALTHTPTTPLPTPEYRSMTHGELYASTIPLSTHAERTQPIDLMAEVNKGAETLAKMMADKAGGFMSTFVDAMQAHMATCNGSDGHVFNQKLASGANWVKAYDEVQQAISQELQTDKALVDASKSGTLTAELETKLQKLALKVYGEKLGTDTTKLQAMSSELYRMSDPAMAMSMMQGALSHVGCACHPAQLGAMSPTLFAGMPMGIAPNQEHVHKHQEILCTSCGWTGVQCESEPCPRCRTKSKWISGAEKIKSHKKKS